MHDEAGHAPEADAAHERFGFEPKDLNGRTLGRLLAILAASVAVSVAAIFGFLHFLIAQQAHDALPFTPQQTAILTPPEPRLQIDAADDLARARAREDSELNAYAWIDAAHTRARIPIARAMSLLAGKPLEPKPAKAAP